MVDGRTRLFHFLRFLRVSTWAKQPQPKHSFIVPFVINAVLSCVPNKVDHW
jgi:hypothetical protein